MLTVESLREWGADVDAGMKRCLNNEAFYLKMVGKAVPDPSFDSLKTALDTGDLDRGFESAHALKGMLGNLELTPLCRPVFEITELLRSRTQMDYSALEKEILEQREKLLALLDS